MRVMRIAALSLACSTFVAPIAAQQPGGLEARYTKTEVRIPMRDGVELFTAVYAPRDTTRRHPILMTRTPYSAGPYGANAYRRALGPSSRFSDEGFIFVYQDVRGRFMSGGDFVNMTPFRGMSGARSTDESTDAYDTIDWLVKHVPHNNGRVGIWGVSYGGFFTAAALVNAHPALKAASPQAPQADWFMGDDVHHHGAFWLTSAFNFFTTSGLRRSTPTTAGPKPFPFPTKDGYQFFLHMGPLSNADSLYIHGGSPFWIDMMNHGTLDAFWKARQLTPHLRNVKPAVLTVGGWYDANNLYGALHVHDAIAHQSPATSNRIVVGPWFHGQWVGIGRPTGLGDLDFGTDAGAYFRDSIELPWFDHYLRHEPAKLPLPNAVMFETGTNRWRTFSEWPPRAARTRSLYLHEGGKVSFAPPAPNEKSRFDEYVSDPSAPVPFLKEPFTDMKPDYMAYDQRFASARPDVLVYTSDPLTADLTVAGSMRPTLYVSTSGTDSDWIVKVIDVWPDSASSRGGFQELVRGDAMRGKFRRSYSRPQPFVPGRAEPVSFGTDDVLHTFKRGHRVMVEIQSTWFPLVDRNPQTFVDIYHARASDFHKATERVFHTSTQPSRLELPVLR